MHAKRAIILAIIVGIMTTIANIAAVAVGYSSGFDAGMRTRVGLIAGVLFFIALISLKSRSQRGVEAFPVPEIIALSAGWILNPFSWVGRSYMGQLFTDAGSLSVSIDFLAWVLSATACAVAAAAWLRRPEVATRR